MLIKDLFHAIGHHLNYLEKKLRWEQIIERSAYVDDGELFVCFLLIALYNLVDHRPGKATKEEKIDYQLR